MSIPISGMDLTSLGIGLIGLAIGLAGIVLLRPTATSGEGRPRAEGEGRGGR